MITVRKLKLTIVNEDEKLRKEQYKFIRDSQYAQYQALNLGMGYIMAGYLANNRDVKSEGFKECQKNLKNSNPIFEGLELGKGIDTLSSVTQKVKKDFSTSLKNGLAKGEISSINYKRTFPLMTRGRDLTFYYNDDDIYIKWVNKIIFKVVLGHKGYNSEELMHTLNKIIEGQNLLKNEKDKDIKKELSKKIYKVSQSSLEFDRNNNLILNLTIDIPFKKEEGFVKGRTLGVDLGVKYPAYVCLNDDTYKREHIGEALELIKQRKQYQERRRRTQQQLKNVKGGKGRYKKLKNLNRLSECERNFAKTYNHMISKRIVDFAKKHKCEFINMENLTKEGFSDSILRNWSYYELQSMVEYKADRIGIKVRYVNPAYTSQTCSRCGHIDKENRQTQEKFICTKCGFELNADHNASINIAKSEEFIK